MVVRDLWPGADVRWVGPDRGAVRLRHGDQAVVVDAGRHHLSAFGTMSSSARSRRPGVRRGVVIELRDGSRVSVPREHLELVAPDHPLTPEPDGAQAAWWLEQLASWGSRGLPVASLAPRSFPAVAQVLHPWRSPEGRMLTWAEAAEQLGLPSVRALDGSRRGDNWIALPSGATLEASPGELDPVTAGVLVDLLGAATATPDDVFVAVWTGWGDVPAQRFPGAAHLDTEARGHFLLRGPLAGVLTSVAAVFERPVAGLWWPADRAWFVVTEIDFEWTFVAGDEALIGRLVADDRLEAARTAFDAAANEAAEPT